MNEAMMNLMNRRSIRKYEGRQVPDELLDQVLQAGIHAASGMNTQGVRLVAVRDPETVVNSFSSLLFTLWSTCSHSKCSQTQK